MEFKDYYQALGAPDRLVCGDRRRIANWPEAPPGRQPGARRARPDAAGQRGFRRAADPGNARHTSASPRHLQGLRAAADAFRIHSRETAPGDVFVDCFAPRVVRVRSAWATTRSRLQCAGSLRDDRPTYGHDGPRAHLAGHDINYLGYDGVLDHTGVRDGPPALCTGRARPLGGAASAAIAILRSWEPEEPSHGRYHRCRRWPMPRSRNLLALHALEQWGHVVPRGAASALTGGVP